MELQTHCNIFLGLGALILAVESYERKDWRCPILYAVVAAAWSWLSSCKAGSVIFGCLLLPLVVFLNSSSTPFESDAPILLTHLAFLPVFTCLVILQKHNDASTKAGWRAFWAFLWLALAQVVSAASRRDPNFLLRGQVDASLVNACASAMAISGTFCFTMMLSSLVQQSDAFAAQTDQLGQNEEKFKEKFQKQEKEHIAAAESWEVKLRDQDAKLQTEKENHQVCKAALTDTKAKLREALGKVQRVSSLETKLLVAKEKISALENQARVFRSQEQIDPAAELKNAEERNIPATRRSIFNIWGGQRSEDAGAAAATSEQQPVSATPVDQASGAQPTSTVGVDAPTSTVGVEQARDSNPYASQFVLRQKKIEADRLHSLACNSS